MIERNIFRWRLFFMLMAVEGLAAAVVLASLPSDADRGLLLGFSAARLALMGVLLSLTAVCSALAWQIGKPASRIRVWLPNAWPVWGQALLLAGSLGLALSAWLLISLLPVLYRTSGGFIYLAYYQRLLPLLIWLVLLGAQAFIWTIWTGRLNWTALRETRGVFTAGALVWGVLGLLALFVSLTRIGITPDEIGWGAPDVPLMEWQLWLGWLAGGLLLWGLARQVGGAGLSERADRRLDWVLAAAVWALAVFIWASIPVPTAFFATAGRAPNFEIYPFSDGAYYDRYAQSILIGNGFNQNEIAARPLYVVFLAAAHALVGQRYEPVIFVQTLLLAFLPVGLYFLGKKLHSHALGLSVALLTILREVTSIHATPFTNKISNSKLFFADLPATLGVVLVVLAAVIWLMPTRRRWYASFVLGGVTGLAMLVRTQVVFILAVLLAVSFLADFRQWKRWLRAVALVALGVMLVVSPWLLRNWRITGRPVFDDPASQIGVMAERYSLETRDLGLRQQGGEDLAEYSSRASSHILSFMFAHPDVVAGYVSAHFFNSQIENVLVLPLRTQMRSFNELLLPDWAFWETWNGQTTFNQTLLLLLNLGLIGLGIGASWKRVRWAGLLPLAANLGYNFSNALARNSGYRYLLPVDWAGYFYAALGALELAVALLMLCGLPANRLIACLAPRSTMRDEHPSPVSPRKWIATAVLFVALGSLLPLAEIVVPQRYPPRPRQALVDQVLSSPAFAASGIDPARFEAFALRDDTQVVWGRALYPRYYDAGDGEPRTAKTGYEPLDYARVVFPVTSQSNPLVIFPVQMSPALLPNASDVIVVGCRGKLHLRAAVVAVLGEQSAVYISSDGIPADCSLVP